MEAHKKTSWTYLILLGLVAATTPDRVVTTIASGPPFVQPNSVNVVSDNVPDDDVPASSPLALLVLLAILMTVSWAILRPKWGARHPA